MTTRRWKTSSTRSRSTWLNLIPFPGSDRLGRSRNDPVKQSQSTGAIFPVCGGQVPAVGWRASLVPYSHGMAALAGELRGRWVIGAHLGTLMANGDRQYVVSGKRVLVSVGR